MPSQCARSKVLPAPHYVSVLTSVTLLLTAIKLVVVIRTVVGTVAAQYSHDAVAALTPELVRITIRRWNRIRKTLHGATTQRYGGLRAHDDNCIHTYDQCTHSASNTKTVARTCKDAQTQSSKYTMHVLCGQHILVIQIHTHAWMTSWRRNVYIHQSCKQC